MTGVTADIIELCCSDRSEVHQVGEVEEGYLNELQAVPWWYLALIQGEPCGLLQ